MKNCKKCAQPFEVTDQDRAFYDKVSPVFNGKKFQIPEPTYCPDCRQQRRMSFRNERNLYHRKCDLTNKEIISMYSADKPFKVYDRTVWWSDKFNPVEYGREFDFSRPFFDQFHELFKAVPRMALNNKEAENSEYCNFALENKNCYLIFTSARCENTYFSNRVFKTKDCSDLSNTEESELCYEVIDSINGYNSIHLQNCANCSDCSWGYNLRNCSYCFGCANLNNAKYQIFNEQYSESDYRKKIAELKKDPEKVLEKFNQIKLQAVRKYMNGNNLEDCTGDSLFNSKNAHECYEGQKLQDCKFVSNATNLKDVYDTSNDDFSELDYECIGSEQNYMHCFNDICWFNSNLLYNSLCFNSSNLFGCIGMKKNQYCILNKQYTKEEYETLVPRIIEHMKAKGEWGEFFPTRISPFAYNETLAQEYFSLTSLEAKKLGASWKEDDTINRYEGPKIAVPTNINDVTDDILKQILTCTQCGKNYKIIRNELELYRKLQIPVPLKCFDCRHKARIHLRNPRKLWQRTCGKCSTPIQTTYAPDRPEKVYCEPCYLKAVY